MDSVSQNSRRQRRPWTDADQQQADAMRAEGLGYAEIGRRIGRHPSTVRCKLSTEASAATREAVRRYREAHRSEAREYALARYYANIEDQRKKNSKWRKNNPEKKRSAQRRWDLANPEKRRENRLRSYRSDLARSREKARSRCAFRRSTRRIALLPVTRAAIDARFALWDNRCAFCGVDAAHQRNHGRERLTVEHVLALTKGGLDEASNIIPACTACNSSKNNSPIEDWYRQQEWFTEARWRKVQRHCPAAVVGQLPLGLL
jgi:hypothetical protein